MRRLRRLLAAGWLLALPTVAAAQTAPEPAPTDLIATLNTVCVAAHGDAATAALLAAESGYSAVPESALPRMRNTSQRAGFIRTNATDMSFVMTGRMTRRVGRETIIMDFCGVSARPTDHRALDDRLRAVMGFPSINAIGFEAYAWLQTPQGRTPARSLPDAQLVAMAGTGQMRMLALDRSGPGSTVMYILPRLD